MNIEQIDLMQNSFAKVVPIAGTAAGLFYQRLFEIAPEVKPLFKRDIGEQGRMLMAALTTVVNGLKNLGDIVTRRRAVGRPPRQLWRQGRAL